MHVNKNSVLTSLACAVVVTLATAGTSTAQNLVSNPGYTGSLDAAWEGWIGANVPPSGWISAAGGVATVIPPSAAEANFYQSFGAGPAGNPALSLGTSYSFTIQSSSSTLLNASSAVAFVKAFDGGWGFLGGEFQTVNLPFDGSTTTINFTPGAGAFYQIGTYTLGVTGGSYNLQNPSLVVVPEPTTFALAGLGAAALLIVRRRS
jgi:hypothetical protein